MTGQNMTDAPKDTDPTTGDDTGQAPGPTGQDPQTTAPATTPPAWTPPTREEWEKVTRGLKETSAESARRKEELRRLAAANATDDEKRATEVADRTRHETESVWRPRYVAAEARSVLAAAGCTDVTRWARIIDTGAVEIADDGTVTGIEAQVTALKADYPEAFTERPRRRTTTPQQATGTDDGIAAPGTSRAPARKQTATERQVARMLGHR